MGWDIDRVPNRFHEKFLSHLIDFVKKNRFAVSPDINSMLEERDVCTNRIIATLPVKA